MQKRADKIDLDLEASKTSPDFPPDSFNAKQMLVRAARPLRAAALGAAPRPHALPMLREGKVDLVVGLRDG
jgi:hypothetical protein